MMIPIMLTRPYQASGGESEYRTYPGGEDVTIEIQQKNNFAVVWSSLTPLGGLLELVRPTLEGQRGKVRMGKLDGEPVDVSKRKVVETVAADPKGWNCANFSLGREYVTWAMPTREAPHLGEIGFATKNPASEWLRKLLHETAMPSIVEDADGIFGSLERLTTQAS